MNIHVVNDDAQPGDMYTVQILHILSNFEGAAVNRKEGDIRDSDGVGRAREGVGGVQLQAW